MKWLASQISDPLKFRRLNGWLVIFWAGMFPVSLLTGLVNILEYVTLLSLYANFATHLGAWAASRAEAKQVEIEEAKEVKVSHTNSVDVEQVD